MDINKESLVLDIRQEEETLERELEEIRDKSYQNIKTRINESKLTQEDKDKCMEILDDLSISLMEAYEQIVLYLDYNL